MKGKEWLGDKLQRLVNRDKTDELKLFLSQGRVGVDWRNGAGETALLTAAFCGRRDSAALLIKAGADATIADNRGTTPLMWLVRQNLVDLAMPFVAAGADVNHANNDGDTALMWATDFAAAETVEALLRAGADVNLADKRGHTALSRARSRQIADLLRPHCDKTTVARAFEDAWCEDVKTAVREWLTGTH